MPPRELSAAKASPEYAAGYFAAWRQERRDSPYYNRAQTERFKRGYEQAEMEGALVCLNKQPTPLSEFAHMHTGEEDEPMAITVAKLVAGLACFIIAYTLASGLS